MNVLFRCIDEIILLCLCVHLRLSVCASRMVSRGRFDSSSSPIGRSRAFQSLAKVSSTSSVRCTRQRNSLARTARSQSTAGMGVLNPLAFTICICTGLAVFPFKALKIPCVFAFAGGKTQKCKYSYVNCCNSQS